MPANADLLRSPLDGQTAIVTGASRGIGRGIAIQLGEQGATVYITGRRPTSSFSNTESGLPSLEETAKEIRNRGGEAIIVYCDHTNAEEVKKLFEKVESDTNGQLDILVNNAFAGAPSIVQYGGLKFYEAPPEMWDEINEVGLRNHYFCSVLAARMMVKRKRGLIVNISSAGGLQYVFNVPYGVGKAAMDRMAADMALELKSDGVSVVSLWPGVVQTELGMSSLKKGVLVKALNMPQDLLEESMTHGETPEFVGKAVAALAKDRNRIKKSGRILLTTDLAREYRFRDVKDVMPPNLRSVRAALQFFGWPRLAQFVPSFIRIPTVFLHFASYKF